MKIIIFGIIALLAFASFSFEKGHGHNPNFEVQTSEDILKFCEFFYEEYNLLGVDALVEQHPNFPNLRACVILYNHIAWNSSHEARDLVLIDEIEKYLGDSSYIKDRHVEYSDIIPDWIKREAQLWVNDENQDIGFAYGIRTLLEAGVITFELDNRQCHVNKICFNENDFIKYAYFDKYGNNISLKHTVISVDNSEFELNEYDIPVYNSKFTIKIEKISQEGKTKDQMIVNSTGSIISKECCENYEFLIPIPIKLGDTVSEKLKIMSETTYRLDGQVKPAWLASDLTNQNVKIIDKKTGLVFSFKHHETEVLTVGEETKITDTNFFEKNTIWMLIM